MPSGRNAKNANFLLRSPSIQIRTSAQLFYAPLTAEEERTRTAKRNEGGVGWGEGEGPGPETS